MSQVQREVQQSWQVRAGKVKRNAGTGIYWYTCVSSSCPLHVYTSYNISTVLCLPQLNPPGNMAQFFCFQHRMSYTACLIKV